MSPVPVIEPTDEFLGMLYVMSGGGGPNLGVTLLFGGGLEGIGRSVRPHFEKSMKARQEFEETWAKLQELVK